MPKVSRLNSIADIEGCMAYVMMQPSYEKVLKEYHRLLNIMGNVDGDEVVPLVLVAFMEGHISCQ